MGATTFSMQAGFKIFRLVTCGSRDTDLLLIHVKKKTIPKWRLSVVSSGYLGFLAFCFWALDLISDTFSTVCSYSILPRPDSSKDGMCGGTDKIRDSSFPLDGTTRRNPY